MRFNIKTILITVLVLICGGVGVYISPIMVSYILGALVVGYLSVLVTMILREKRRQRKEIIDRIDGRIWSIPITLECQTCRRPVEVEFSLDSNSFYCDHCQNNNRIYIQFITTPIDPTNPNIE